MSKPVILSGKPARRHSPLPPLRRKQVTRSARVLWSLAAIFFAVALVAVFIIGAIYVARGSEQLGLSWASPLFLVVYAVAFAVLVRRLKL